MNVGERLRAGAVSERIPCRAWGEAHIVPFAASEVEPVGDFDHGLVGLHESRVRLSTHRVTRSEAAKHAQE